MTHSSWDANLARVLRFLCIGLVSFIAAVAVVVSVPGSRMRLADHLSGNTRLEVGGLVRLPFEADARRVTLVVFSDPGCGACQAAEDPLRDLVLLSAEYRTDAVLLVPGHVSGPEASDYARTLGFSENRVFSWTARDFQAGLRIVPTVLLVGPEGRIRLVVEGAPGLRRPTILASVRERLNGGLGR